MIRLVAFYVSPAIIDGHFLKLMAFTSKLCSSFQKKNGPVRRCSNVVVSRIFVIWVYKNEKWLRVNENINILLTKNTQHRNKHYFQPRNSNLTAIVLIKLKIIYGINFNTYQMLNFQSVRKQLIQYKSVINYM